MTVTIKMAETSPKWKRPSDVMKIRKKRKSVTRPKRVLGPQENLQTKQAVSGAGGDNTGPVKRRNPFGCSPRKRANLGTISNNAPSETANSLLDVLSANEAKDEVNSVSTEAANYSSKLQETQEPTNEEVTKNVEESPIEGTPDCPVDWSLKTKVRFVTTQTFSWCANLKTTEESRGINAFVRGTPTQKQEVLVKSGITSEAKSEFHRHCMLWMHPNLPWLKLFPRIVGDTKLGKPSALLLGEETQNALMADWTDSFTSVFHQLRCGGCPYFYMCTHQFTALFRAAGVNQRSQIHAIITPTSRGFREALKKEGIEFHLPLSARTWSSIDTKVDKTPESAERAEASVSDIHQEAAPEDNTEGEKMLHQDDDEEEDIARTDDGASSWLQSIGVNAAKFRTLDPSKVKLEREGFRVIDHRPESTVLVEGADTQALFNYLLNCRSCVASTGAQAGVPPTLLAPVAFKGATLKTLKTKTSVVRQSQSTGHQQAGYSVEVAGPILPHTIHGLQELFGTTLGHFTASHSVHEPTTSFNAVPGENLQDDREQGAVAMEKLVNCGTQESHIENIIKESELGRKAIRELGYSDGLYTWTL